VGRWLGFLDQMKFVFAIAPLSFGAGYLTGRAGLMVLAGSVRIHFESGEAIELKRQESAYFDSGIGHVYLSTGKADAQVLVVMAEG